MIHLPQLLYLFRTILIPIPQSFFKSLQTMLNKLIWQGNKPRCAHTKLIKHRLVRGSWYIDFRRLLSGLRLYPTTILVPHFSAITLGYDRILLTPSTKPTNLDTQNTIRHSYTSLSFPNHDSFSSSMEKIGRYKVTNLPIHNATNSARSNETSNSRPNNISLAY